MSDSSSSSGKSKEEVAFDILAKLKGVGIWGENNKENILDMYAECLIATSGLRPVKGQVVAAPPARPAAAAPAAQPYVPPQQGQGGQAVHAQQAHIQQAFKPAT